MRETVAFSGQMLDARYLMLNIQECTWNEIQKHPISRNQDPGSTDESSVKNLFTSAGPIDHLGMHESAREAMFTNVAKGLPVKRVGRPADIASIAVELMSNSFITGAVIDIDGGGLLS